jgi:hypothetical protein
MSSALAGWPAQRTLVVRVLPRFASMTVQEAPWPAETILLVDLPGELLSAS